MANIAHTFSFPAYQLRTVMIDGEPWFVAADICAALGISNSRDATARLDDDEKGVGSIDTPQGGPQQVTIVNESGLYSLILGCRKPEAKPFKRWVTAEVLPSIRRTGRYDAAGQQVLEQAQSPLALALAERTEQLDQARAERDAALHQVVRTQADLIREIRRTARLERVLTAREKVQLVINMERRGEPRHRIRAHTGLNYNHIRQICFRARAEGELPPVQDADALQAMLDLEAGARHE